VTASGRLDVRDGAIVVLLKAAIGALLLAAGFRAVSDDDFARVVIAQTWAAAPRLDPTGTSWLPWPFWSSGAVMLLADRSLATARAVAFALGLGAMLLVYASARLLGIERRGAVLGTAVAAVLPWSARLGVATVPELPTAALSLFALATLASARGSHRVLGALALSGATLSRYEPWVLAVVFVAMHASERLRPGADRPPVAAAAIAVALALLGPFAWLGHNALVHGDALHFAARVSAYRQAVGARSALADAFGYPLALLREEPELCLLAAVLLGARWHRREGVRPSARRVVIGLGVLVAGLMVAAVRGGAPTHHAGRALLGVWLALALFVGAEAEPVLGRRDRWRPGLVGLLLVILALGAAVLRPWFSRLDSMAARADETAIGLAAGRLVPAGGRILLAVEDYGFFAIEAASGRPELFVLDRDIDPRAAQAPSSFASPTRLRARLAEVRATHAAGRESPATAMLGAPLATAGDWRLWPVEHR
jgi:hypothetical protein